MVNAKSTFVKSDFENAAHELLQWYDQMARRLPWRLSPQARKNGDMPDPYRVWLSEIMLQQTTVPHAAPYFDKFTRLWPKVEDLAAAHNDDVMREWAGLGYYARARNLHKCAKVLAGLDAFPNTIEALLALPGVGPYTAAAVGSIAFDLPVAPVDGNIERVISRLMAIAGDGSAAGWAQDKKEITQRVQTLVPQRSGDFAQAMMDLGASVCTPKSPNCMICPWMDICLARQEGNQESYPAKPKRKPQPIRNGLAFVIFHEGKVLLQRRPDSGLLGGMLMPLSSPWEEGGEYTLEDYQPVKADWHYRGQARHVFTHFALHWDVYVAHLTKKPDLSGDWIDIDMCLEAGLPTVGRKALKLALDA
ncbi:A/G-specific adenine glycosylase [Hirschia baltica]|uniref:Adenine DNA glycosylase n=1 Tax=Hirschia baltica (strain ATCC 49814 / DSM 5838 / IFAM 1418) TaxID=582402 RepID=C6XRC5_HIRBI|nr:A/G-specific adenine glycosylase [Hirschia baltica]ACT58757.1 HhH-GPD family protein [Hirschia baltica ATCC 49814]